MVGVSPQGLKARDRGTRIGLHESVGPSGFARWLVRERSTDDAVVVGAVDLVLVDVEMVVVHDHALEQPQAPQRRRLGGPSNGRQRRAEGRGRVRLRLFVGLEPVLGADLGGSLRLEDSLIGRRTVKCTHDDEVSSICR